MTEIKSSKIIESLGSNRSFYIDSELALVLEIEERDMIKSGQKFNLSKLIKDSILFFVKYRGEKHG